MRDTHRHIGVDFDQCLILHDHIRGIYKRTRFYLRNIKQVGSICILSHNLSIPELLLDSIFLKVSCGIFNHDRIENTKHDYNKEADTIWATPRLPIQI